MAASNAQRFAVVFDFPVPPRKEWMDMIFAIVYYPLAELKADD
jgi:hypothetical protein